MQTPPPAPPIPPERRKHHMRLVLVPAHMLEKMRSVAQGMVPAGGTLDMVLKLRCRNARRYGAPSRRSTCYDHLLMEVQPAVLSHLFPRQRGLAVKLGRDTVARRYIDTSAESPCIDEDQATLQALAPIPELKSVSSDGSGIVYI
jgi:hypothetical protein